MWEYAITLQGHAKDDKSTLRFVLNNPADYVAAAAMANSIRGSLVDITNAFVSKEVLSNVLSEDGTRPAEGISVFDEAVVSVYLTADGTKLHTLRVPAPIAALFSAADAQTLVATNALLVQYVQQVSQGALVSDNETVNLTITDGIAGGYRRSRPRRFRTL